MQVNLGVSRLTYLPATARRDSVNDLPAVRCALAGAAFGAGGFGIFSALLLLITPAGARYQTGGRGSTTEYEMWAPSLFAPPGTAVAGAVAGVALPLARRW